MPCADDEHLFWPGTHGEVVRAADRPTSAQTARLWPCALCGERVDLLADEHKRRAETGDSTPTRA